MLAELTASWLLSMILKSFPSLVLNHSIYTFLVMVKTEYLLQFEHVLGKLILCFYLWHPQNTLFIPQALRIIIYTQQGLSYYAMQDWADSLDYFHAFAFDYHFCRSICTAYALDEMTLKDSQLIWKITSSQNFLHFYIIICFRWWEVVFEVLEITATTSNIVEVPPKIKNKITIWYNYPITVYIQKGN